MPKLALKMTRKQQEFINADAFEVLFGGAAGGAKSHGQVLDALLYALTYAGSKQLVLRRTYQELEKSLIRASLQFYPREVCKYNDSAHMWRFTNGSLIDFGYCDYEKDVYRYQSAEYDVIRFDELTHFTESMYTYLISRVRGANDFPKRVKSSTNPGGVGHAWVKARFIDPAPAGTVWQAEFGSRVFIPSLVQDNPFLMKSDPEYLTRLENLNEREKKALLYGDWNIFEGQYFAEFDPAVHVRRAFGIPAHWRRYRALDYGLDMLACLWIAVDESGRAFVYRELYEPGLIISDAAKRILDTNAGERVAATLAPPDLWNRRQETGKSAYDIFAANGVPMVKTSNDRVDGWYAVKEYLKVCRGQQDVPEAQLVIFENCRNLIRTLPALLVDDKNPNDAAREPHEVTHAPDALRAFCVTRTLIGKRPEPPKDWDEPGSYEEQVEMFITYGR